jgi:hypothetical protein
MSLTTPPSAGTFLALTKSFARPAGKTRTGAAHTGELFCAQTVSYVKPLCAEPLSGRVISSLKTRGGPTRATSLFGNAPAALDRHELAAGDYRFALDLVDEKWCRCGVESRFPPRPVPLRPVGQNTLGPGAPAHFPTGNTHTGRDYEHARDRDAWGRGEEGEVEGRVR